MIRSLRTGIPGPRRSLIASAAVTPGPGTRLRVAVDANPLLGERTGVGHFTASLLDGLARRDDVTASAYAITRTGRDDLADQLPPGVRPATSWVPARVAHALWARTPLATSRALDRRGRRRPRHQLRRAAVARRRSS